ncbi:MAG: hypothetical protein HZA17_14485 [Nitrospirae bacterium]|nr:hypothetical protein [Nitrospirota bacterium]
MRNFLTISCFILVSLHLCSGLSSAATYYVRPDGGSSEQCTGIADAPYPGSGSDQQCSWAHPYWALDSEGHWKIAGGDTIFIHTGSYMMGYGAPNTAWCDPEGSFACVLPSLPSGSDSQNPTRILGAGWNSGCQDPPELWGTQHADRVLDLSGTSNAEIYCLELTDHSGCVESHSNSSIACNRDTFPYGEWASVGLYAVDSANVILSQLNIHGFAAAGINAARLTDWTVEDVRISGNGFVGWDGDLAAEENDSNSGTLTFRRLTVEWSGCAETYPGKQPDHCWAQSAGGYGDGMGVARSGGHWIIEDSIFRYNTSDGLDLLYVGVDNPSSMVLISRTVAMANAGNQIKIGGSSTIYNSLVIANCGFFYQKPFSQEMGDKESGDQCRAGGGAISINLGQSDFSEIVSSTIVGEGWALIEAQCHTLDFPDQLPCNKGETVTIQNNIFMGYPYFLRDDGVLSEFIGDSDPYHFTEGTVSSNVIYNVRDSACPYGLSDICTNPFPVNPDLSAFDGRLLTESPAIDSGLQAGGIDLTGALRPFGNGSDRGAYEYGASPVPAIMANGSEGEITMRSADLLSLTIGLDSRNSSDLMADWWIAACSPFGCFSYALPGVWNYLASIEDLKPVYQGRIFSIPSFEILSISGLPEGAYLFFFGLDTMKNNRLDFEWLNYDSVHLNVIL